MHLYKGVPLSYTGLCTSLEPQLISLYLFVFGLQVARHSWSLLKRSLAIVQSLYQSIFKGMFVCLFVFNPLNTDLPNHSSIKTAANSRDEPVICLHVTDNLAKSVFLKNIICSHFFHWAYENAKDNTSLTGDFQRAINWKLGRSQCGVQCALKDTLETGRCIWPLSLSVNRLPKSHQK